MAIERLHFPAGIELGENEIAVDLLVKHPGEIKVLPSGRFDFTPEIVKDSPGRVLFTVFLTGEGILEFPNKTIELQEGKVAAIAVEKVVYDIFRHIPGSSPEGTIRGQIPDQEVVT